MKQVLIFSILFFLFAFNCLAKDEFAVGYFITKNNDTVLCKILVPKAFGKFDELSLFSKVTVLDSAGDKIKYTPNDINGYAFVYNEKIYNYVSKAVDDNGEMKFLWPVNVGKKINEYCYYRSNSDNLDKGGMASVDINYVLENALTGETTAITRGGSVMNTYKDQLRRFFENDNKLMALITRDVHDYTDIQKFVEDANN
jgi:hypothetical protein